MHIICTQCVYAQMHDQILENWPNCQKVVWQRKTAEWLIIMVAIGFVNYTKI